MKRREFLGGAFTLAAASLVLPPATLLRASTRAIDPRTVMAGISVGDGWLITGVHRWALKDPAKRPTLFQHFDHPFGLYSTFLQGQEWSKAEAETRLREFVEHLAEHYVEVV